MPPWTWAFTTSAAVSEYIQAHMSRHVRVSRAGARKSRKRSAQAQAGRTVHVIELGNTRSLMVPRTQVARSATTRRRRSVSHRRGRPSRRVSMSAMETAYAALYGETTLALSVARSASMPDLRP